MNCGGLLERTTVEHTFGRVAGRPVEGLPDGQVGQTGKREKACSGKEAWSVVQTNFVSVTPMCITHRMCVSLKAVVEGGRGVVGPDR